MFAIFHFLFRLSIIPLVIKVSWHCYHLFMNLLCSRIKPRPLIMVYLLVSCTFIPQHTQYIFWNSAIQMCKRMHAKGIFKPCALNCFPRLKWRGTQTHQILTQSWKKYRRFRDHNLVYVAMASKRRCSNCILSETRAVAWMKVRSAWIEKGQTAINLVRTCDSIGDKICYKDLQIFECPEVWIALTLNTHCCAVLWNILLLKYY